MHLPGFFEKSKRSEEALPNLREPEVDSGVPSIFPEDHNLNKGTKARPLQMEQTSCSLETRMAGAGTVPRSCKYAFLLINTPLPRIWAFRAHCP